TSFSITTRRRSSSSRLLSSTPMPATRHSTTSSSSYAPWDRAPVTTSRAPDRSLGGKLSPHGLVQEGPQADRGLEGQAGPRAGRALAQVRGLCAGDLQQGSRRQRQRLPQMRPSFPHERRRPPATAV